MADSGFIVVFLPVISAFMGAIIGAWANSWYRNREAEKARDQERDGLLILLTIEIDTNYGLFETFLTERVSQPDIDNRQSVADNLHSAVWDESKVRFAQLRLPGSYLKTVALYYESIGIVRRSWTEPPRDLSEDETESVRTIMGHGLSVIHATQRYISDRDPEFIERPLDDVV